MAAEKELCKKQACAIQFCLQRHGYQESKCAAVIKQYYNCYAATMEAEVKARKSTDTIVTAGNDNGKAKRGINEEASLRDLEFGVDGSDYAAKEHLSSDLAKDPEQTGAAYHKCAVEQRKKV